MFNFFKKQKRHNDVAESTAPNESVRKPNARDAKADSRLLPKIVEDTRAPDKNSAPENNSNTTQEAKTVASKHVVNLLIPQTDYNREKSGVGAIIQNIMAGNKKKRKPSKKKQSSLARAESCRNINVSDVPPLIRSHSNLERSHVSKVTSVTEAENNTDGTEPHVQSADFVKALVLQRYSKPTQKKQHVTLVYVTDDREGDASERKDHTSDTEYKQNLDPHPSSFTHICEQNLSGSDSNLETSANKEGSKTEYQTNLVNSCDQGPYTNFTKTTENESNKQDKIKIKDSDRRHAEDLLREIARKLDNFNDQMGVSDSKSEKKHPSPKNDMKHLNNQIQIPIKEDIHDDLMMLDKRGMVVNKPKEESVYEEIESHPPKSNDQINKILTDDCEIHDKCLSDYRESDNEHLIFSDAHVEQITVINCDDSEFQDAKDVIRSDSLSSVNKTCDISVNNEKSMIDLTKLELSESKKKSNLKLPKSDPECISDDERSDTGKKVTFNKVIDFDDGDQQDDRSSSSSLESFTDSEEESEDLSDSKPDNDELLGGVVVSRSDERIPQLVKDKTEDSKDDVIIEEITDEFCIEELSGSEGEYTDETDEEILSEDSDKPKIVLAKSKHMVDITELSEKEADELENVLSSDCIKNITSQILKELDNFVKSTEGTEKTDLETCDLKSNTLEKENQIIIQEKESDITLPKNNNIQENTQSIAKQKEELKGISSDNSDSGFLEIDEKQNETSRKLSVSEEESESESEIEVTDTDEDEEVEEELEDEEEEEEYEKIEDLEKENKSPDYEEQKKGLISHGAVEELTQLAAARASDAQVARDQLLACRKELQGKDQEIEHLKCELSAAYKESELIRQRSRSLEEDLAAARSCAHQAEQAFTENEATERSLREQLEKAQTRLAELESKVLALEEEIARLKQEKGLQEQRAQEALEAAEANATRWRKAHEAARSQAATQTERLMADCEWKMRELEKRARDAEKQKLELQNEVERVRQEKNQPSPAHRAELSQLRGYASEQQRSVQALQVQLSRLETREDELKLEVHRLKDLLEREANSSKEKDERYSQTIRRLEKQHGEAVEATRAQCSAAAAAARVALERAHAERTRTAIAQLRADHERDGRNADRKLREVTARYDALKETIEEKEREWRESIAEARSKADWELMQLRHLLDKADIAHANNAQLVSEQHDAEKERLVKEWTARLEDVETAAAAAAAEAKALLESTTRKILAEKNEQISKMKEQHRNEMDAQWEQFMTDKEECLARMKQECRQEGEEDRREREKELLEQINELKQMLSTKNSCYNDLAYQAAATGRTLAVTEQELREALERERLMREKHSEEVGKSLKAKKAAQEQIEHLTRKCACLRKLFDDIRAKLTVREREAGDKLREKDKEISSLKAEVARLTRMLFSSDANNLGARTRADGCDSSPQIEGEPFFSGSAPSASSPQPAARRKGGTLRTPEFPRKNPNSESFPEIKAFGLKHVSPDVARRRAKSVDLPAVQVPVRIKQIEDCLGITDSKARD